MTPANPGARRLVRPTTTVLTRRGLLGGAAGLLALSACGNEATKPSTKTASSLKPDGDLNLFTYADYVPKKVLSGFEETYGVKVNQTYFSTGEEMIAKLVAKQPFDIAFAPSERIHRMVQAGLLQRVDHDAMKNYDEVLPAFHTPPYNPGDDAANKEIAPYVGAPYATGGVGLAWRKDRVTKMTGSFNDLWDATEADGHIYLWDDLVITMQMTLVHLGIKPSEATQDDLDQAAESIRGIRAKLGGFSGVDTQMIQNGQAWLTPAYAGDMFLVLSSVSDPDNWGFQMNKESALFNADNMVVPATSEHPGTALTFIDYILRPDVMKKVVNYIGYPIPTTTGMATYQKLTQAYPWLAFDDALFEQPDQWITPIPDDEFAMWQKAWAKAKLD